MAARRTLLVEDQGQAARGLGRFREGMTPVACRQTRQPLLGTIVGITERCHAPAAGGVSDPAEVSRGIGTALVATAVGIASALQGPGEPICAA